jgi:amidase
VAPQSQWSIKTAVETSAALAARQVSSVELAQGAIGRIEHHDAKINAICVRIVGPWLVDQRH